YQCFGNRFYLLTRIENELDSLFPGGPGKFEIASPGNELPTRSHQRNAVNFFAGSAPHRIHIQDPRCICDDAQEAAISRAELGGIRHRCSTPVPIELEYTIRSGLTRNWLRCRLNGAVIWLLCGFCGWLTGFLWRF